MADKLAVSLYGTHVGLLRRSKHSPKRLVSFIPSEDGVERFGSGSTALSESVPLVSSGSKVTDRNATNFFGGLLAEGAALSALARNLRVSDNDVFGLISGQKSNLIGAIGVRSDEALPESYELLRPAQMSLSLEYPDESLIDVSGGSSIPGVQPKTTLFRGDDDTWYRPVNGAPTSHIIKPLARNGNPAYVHDEGYLIALGRHSGLLSYDSAVIERDGIHALIIERYDRISSSDGSLQRVHQEDFQQALGIDWSETEQRFESYNKKARLRNIAKVLRTHGGISSVDSVGSDLAQLLRYVTFNVGVGNTDAHAKNYSVLKSEDGGVSLAPLYDLNPLGVRYHGRDENALYVGGSSHHQTTDMSHIVKEGVSWGIAEELARYIVEDTLEQLNESIDTIEPTKYVDARLRGALSRQVRNLAQGKRVVDGLTPIGIAAAPYEFLDGRLFDKATRPNPRVNPRLRTSPSAGTCGYWMRNAKRYCSLPARHNGQHR